MAVNKKLKFMQRTKEHLDECMICGRRKLGKEGVAVSFAPDESPEFAAVYCYGCIGNLAKAVVR